MRFEVGVCEARAEEHSRMTFVKLGLLLPHEIFSSFYHYRSGDLFFSMMTGTVDETCQKYSFGVCAFLPASDYCFMPVRT